MIKNKKTNDKILEKTSKLFFPNLKKKKGNSLRQLIARMFTSLFSVMKHQLGSEILLSVLSIKEIT